MVGSKSRLYLMSGQIGPAFFEVVRKGEGLEINKQDVVDWTKDHSRNRDVYCDGGIC